MKRSEKRVVGTTYKGRYEGRLNVLSGHVVNG
jgi:hypothetical protein